jgi:hypothetical protein
LAYLHVRHPRIAALLVYWLISAIASFAMMVVQAAGALWYAITIGVPFWSLQVVWWLFVYSVLLGWFYLPVMLLRGGLFLLGPFGGVAMLGAIAFVVWRAWLWWVTLPLRAVTGQAGQHARAQAAFRTARS